MTNKGHCEVVFSPPKQSHLFAPTRECHCELVVSSAKQSRFSPKGCHCEVVVSFPKQSRFSFPRLVIASLAFSFGEAISSLTLWEYETASLRSQRQQKGEVISLFAIVRLLCLSDKKGSLRSRNFTPFLISHGHKKDFETLVSGERLAERPHRKAG